MGRQTTGVICLANQRGVLYGYPSPSLEAPSLALRSRVHLRGWCNRQHDRFWPCYWGFESSPPSSLLEGEAQVNGLGFLRVRARSAARDHELIADSCSGIRGRRRSPHKG